jgi:thiol-activated cytolysin
MKTKDTHIKLSFTLIGMLFLMLIVACSKDEVGDNPDDPKFSTDEATEFDALIANLQLFSQPEEAPIVEIASSGPERDTEDATLECTSKTYKGAPGYNELFTLDPTTDVIYPGALLKGETIPTGTYEGISANRAPITISASLQNIANVKVDIEDPNKLSNVRQGITDLLNQEVNGATPAEINLDIKEVYSEQHLEAAIGVNYRGVGKKVSADLSFGSSTYKNTFVLKFIQRYYTLDVDTPGASPSDLFTDLPNINLLGSTNPVYVSSVQYGRMVLYTVESNSSITDIKAAFDASVGSSDGTIDTKYQNIINSSNIKALIIGGSGSGAVKAINGPAEVYNFIAEGGNYSKDSPGAPLAYKLRYLKPGFPVAKVVLTTEYQVRECDLAYPEYRVTIVKITGSQPSDTEVHGNLGIRMKVAGGYLDSNNNNLIDGPTWSRTKDNYVDVQNDKTHTINKDYVLKPYRPNMEADFIECYGQLFDYNGVFGSANLGNHTNTKKLSDLKMNIVEDRQITYQAGIVAHFTLTRIK